MTTNLRYWRSLVRDAEAALDTASCLSELKIVARRLMQARQALACLEQAANAGNRQPERLP
jgi:hypothetical protein